jgi:hypothetical protein
MPTNFPTSVDNFTNPTANDSLNLPSHSTQHANANDAIEAIETTLFAGGINYAGLVHVGTTTFTGVTAFTISNCFTSTYDNYMIFLNVEPSGSFNQEVRIQLDASGTPSASGYAWAGFGAVTGGTGASNDTSNSSTYQPVTFVTGASRILSAITIGNPHDAVYTSISSLWMYDDGGTLITRNYVGRHRANTSYNGARFFGPTTMTGTARVYGMRDA